MIFQTKTRSALLASAALAALAAPLAVEAQQITSAIQGTVSAPDGSAAAGATVTIINTQTGLSRSVTVGANGAFNVRNLPTGGPYTVRVSAAGFESYAVTDIMLDASGSGRLPIVLTEEGGAVEEIVVTASAADFSFVALGPSSTFNRAQIQELPSIARSVFDVITLDPRVQFEGGGVSCVGSNNNFNTTTVDGIRFSDGFGLNGSGSIARNTNIIPFDAQGEVSVEFAPISVEYSQFSGCQINIISQRGTNEFHGGAFFQYNNDGLSGSRVNGRDIPQDPFDRYQWGADLGGPIIEDKLFFYVAYEEFETADVFNNNPTVLGGINDDPALDGLTAADIDRFGSILANSYGRDASLLVPVTTQPQTDRRLFGRIDWQINDQHRLEGTYSRLEERNVESDFSGTEFSFRDSFEEEGTTSDAASVRLYSDWNENFSTDIRVSRQSVTDVQGPIGGGEAQAEDIARIVLIEDGLSPFAAGSPFFGGSLFSGPGVFRSANQLNYETDQIRAQAKYVMGDHEFLAGYELESTEVFNLFIPNATGSLFFRSLDDLAAGNAEALAFSGSFTQDPNDAAAAFTRDIHSLYFQDTWNVSDALQIVGGLRYEWYSSEDAPLANPTYQNRYGFTNTTSFDGLDVVLPRLGVNWNMPEEFGETTLRAGIGVFSVAGPTVWFANSFQNFGGAIGEIQQLQLVDANDDGTFDNSSCTTADFQVLGGALPQCLRNDAQVQAQANAGRVDAVDPNFELPTQVRMNLSLSHVTDFGSSFFDDWRVSTDFIYSIGNNSVDYLDLTLSPNGETTPDGRPIMFAVNPDLPGCNAVLQGPRGGFANADPEFCNAGRDDQDILLTNAQGSDRSINITVQADKTFEFGESGRFNFLAAYNFSDVTLVNTGQNSTATTGFEETVSFVPNRTPRARSNFMTGHAIVLNANIAYDFWEDYTTSINFRFRAQEGNPFSYVFDDRTADIFGDSDREARILPYIPTGPNDPLVDFSGLSADDQSALFAFLEESGLNEYAGEIAPRNTFRGPWNVDLDIRFQQQLPGFMGSDRFSFIMDIQNALNFIDDEWGVNQTPDNGDVGEGVPFIRAGLNGDGQYTYTRFQDRGLDDNVNPSLWRINFMLRYDF